MSHACLAKCSQLPEGAKTRLAARLTPQMVPPGHDLCQEGDDADCMWILQEGMLPLAAQYNTWIFIKLTPKGVVFLSFSMLPLLLRCCGTVEALPLHLLASLPYLNFRIPFAVLLLLC